MSEATHERARDLDRFLTFVDAVVAIAITLLVLPLVELVGDLGRAGSVADLLRDNKATIGGFLLSFVVIASLWLVQHQVLRHVVAATGWLTRLLLGWCVTIVFLPFPTALVAARGDASEQAVTKLLYVGTMATSSFVLSAVCLLVARDPGIRESGTVPDVARSFATSITFVIALVVMLAAPATSYYPLLLLVLPDRVLALARRRSAR